MEFLVYLSYYMIPLLIFYIVGFGLLQKVDVYQEFVKGAKDGMKTVVELLPTLIGLLMSVGILRASGALDIAAEFLAPVAKLLHFDAALIPVSVIKLFSSSAATGLVLDIFETHGPDSLLGKTVSILCSSTETVFYTMSVYFIAAKVKKTRWTLAGGLLSTLAGIIASVWVAQFV
ncbi:MAG: spore maturation protein [Lachnospiraceae bacterium]|nr:spore maturation protein [Lachnospiraceae bacterium]MBP3610040.1 spore maturation protein [Lachnospiraceae bacterium]